MEERLSRDQLKTLAKFIQKKGFREADVQQEILDHFACKVEVLLSEKPSIGLDRAMAQSYTSFGVKGFATIANSYKRWLNKSLVTRMKKEFYAYQYSWEEVAAVLLYLCFYVFVFLNDKHEALESFVLGAMSFSVFVSVVSLIQKRGLARDSMLYKHFSYLIITASLLIFTVGIQGILYGFYTDILINAWGKAFAVFMMWLSTVFVKLHDLMLSYIIRRTDKLKLLTN